MFKKMIASFLVLATTGVFAMSLSALNSASKAELMEINGIGEVKASAIIKERRKGKFKSFDDLTRVEGVGEQIASNVKNGVKVGQEPKKVKRTSKKKTVAKTSKKVDTKSKKTKAKVKKSTKEKAEKKTKSKKRKIKSMDEKKKELKKKARKTKTKKTKAKKEKKTKSKKKN